MEKHTRAHTYIHTPLFGTRSRTGIADQVAAAVVGHVIRSQVQLFQQRAPFHNHFDDVICGSGKRRSRVTTS